VFVQLQCYLGTVISVLTFTAGLSKLPFSKNYTLNYMKKKNNFLCFHIEDHYKLSRRS